MKPKRKRKYQSSPIADQHAILKSSKVVRGVVVGILAKATDYFAKHPSMDSCGFSISVASEPACRAVVAILSAFPRTVSFIDYHEVYPIALDAGLVRTWRLRGIVTRANARLHPEPPAAGGDRVRADVGRRLNNGQQPRKEKRR